MLFSKLKLSLVKYGFPSKPLIYLSNKMSLELTGLVEDFVATGILSKIELDFLETELWETLEHIDEITSLTYAPKNISRKLNLKDNSSWQLCNAAVLDAARPQEFSRTDKLEKLIVKNSLS